MGYDELNRKEIDASASSFPSDESSSFKVLSEVQTEKESLDWAKQAYARLKKQQENVKQQEEKLIDEVKEESLDNIVDNFSENIVKDTVNITENISLDDITESYMNSKFADDGNVEPDLLIRTGGEYRISNFMLWQIAYSEIFVTDTFWPDFDEQALIESIVDFNKRERRCGKISEQI